MPGPGKQETVERIKEAFWSLYEQKPLSEISVKQITNAADYNRGTFYLYFNNTREVLDQIEDDIIEQMIGARDANAMLSFLLIQKPLDVTLESFSKIFFEHQRYLVVLFGDGGDPAFARKLKQAILDKLGPEIQAIANSSKEAVEFAFEYIISGEIGLLTKLFTNPERASEESLQDALELVRIVTAQWTMQS